MKFSSVNDREIMTICGDCLEEKINVGKEKLRDAEDRTLHHSSSGFLVQRTEGIKEVRNVVNWKLAPNSRMCVTFGTYRKSNKRHFRIEDIETIIEILNSAETDGNATCGLCDERREYFSFPHSEEPHLSIKICDKCRISVKEELEEFLESNDDVIISSII